MDPAQKPSAHTTFLRPPPTSALPRLPNLMLCPAAMVSQHKERKAQQPALLLRYSGVTLFVITKRRADGGTARTTIREMDFGGDLPAALEQARLILDSMERVCELSRVAVFIVYKDFGGASVKPFNLPAWLMDPYHYHDRYEALKKLCELGYTDSEGMCMLLRFPD